MSIAGSSFVRRLNDVAVPITDGRLALDVVADWEPQADIWGAERRTEPVEKASGLPVETRWSGGPAAAAG